MVILAIFLELCLIALAISQKKQLKSGRSQQEIAPYPYYHDSALHSAGYHDINQVTWWVLKHQSICLVGLPPKNLAFTVDWNLLQRKMKENLNSYWVN